MILEAPFSSNMFRNSLRQRRAPLLFLTILILLSSFPFVILCLITLLSIYKLLDGIRESLLVHLNLVKEVLNLVHLTLESL